MTTAAVGERSLTSVTAALDVLLAELRTLEVETVPLALARGRVLATDVVAALALPGCDNSAMDGYAVRAADCAAPVTLPIGGESRAGAAAPPHRGGTATRISTGAPLPAGADSVVRIEDTTQHDDTVSLHVAAVFGQNVRYAGEDSHPGDLMVPAGRRLRAVDIAGIAAAGRDRVAVHRAPRVAVIAGGDELVEPGTAPLPHQVVDSNTPMLVAAVREAGGDPLPPLHTGDSEAAVNAALRDVADADVVISSAGVSVGGHDHVRDAVKRHGRVLVWGVAMRPGKPVLIGSVHGTTVLALPGNPVSAAVTFEVFARPAILRLQGASSLSRPRIAVRLAEDVETPKSLETYVRISLSPGEDAIPLARQSGAQGSAMLRPLAAADALLPVPAGIGGYQRGLVVEATLLL